jgi:outer membrane protein assembly factor BamB
MAGWPIVAAADNWPAWRGPSGDGVSTERGLPTRWDRETNVFWRVPLPEPGNSTPVVWGERVFLTQAVGERRTLMCFHRADGRLLWERGVETRGREPTHETNPYCPSSPVTDGERVIAWFGSDGLFCYDLDGNEQWRRDDLGRQVHIWGGGSSPVIHGGSCFLNFGPGETTYLLAVDKTTGRTLWKRDEETGYGKPPTADVQGGEGGEGGPATFIGSWSTPKVVRVDGADQLLMSWPRRLAGYDPATGDEVWTCSGLNPLCYTSPIDSGGVVVTMGGFQGSAMAVRAGGSGDVTADRRVWHTGRTRQRIGSGVIHDGHVYIHNDPGIAECIELATGKVVWEERMPATVATGQNWSSVMLADGLCYTVTQGGDCFVFKASPQFQVVSVNPLGERSNSSVVPSDGALFIRTHEALWCISEGVRPP